MEKEQSYSEDFLNSISKKTTGFKTPDNFMDTLMDSIDTKLASENFPKETGYTTPDSYFKNFTVVVPKQKSKIIQLLPYISIAAVIIIGLFIFTPKTTKTVDFAALDTNDIYEYLELDDVNNTDIALRMSLNKIDELTIMGSDDLLYDYLDNDINDLDILDL